MNKDAKVKTIKISNHKFNKSIIRGVKTPLRECRKISWR